MIRFAIRLVLISALLFALSPPVSGESLFPPDIHERLVKLSPDLNSPDESVRQAAQAERERLIKEAVERKLQAFRAEMAKADAEREAKASAQAKADAEAWEATKAEIAKLDSEAKLKRFDLLLDEAKGNPEKMRRVVQLMEEHRRKLERESEARIQKILELAKAWGQPKELCAQLHPEAKYMTPPDAEGTQRWVKKPVEDFSGFASCFNQRYGGAFAAQDFRPCNSVPDITEAERLRCLFNEERPKPSQWCSERFSRKPDINPGMWTQCTNEFLMLDDMALLEQDRPKTAAEMEQDEQAFAENASARARHNYRACILQFSRPSAMTRQSCRDVARSSDDLQRLFEEIAENFAQ